MKDLKYTGVENKLILNNLAQLLSMNKCVWFRIPAIPEVNDTEEEMKSINTFFKENDSPEKVELLPYHKMGEYKYELLGRETGTFQIPGKGMIEKLSSTTDYVQLSH